MRLRLRGPQENEVSVAGLVRRVNRAGQLSRPTVPEAIRSVLSIRLPFVNWRLLNFLLLVYEARIGRNFLPRAGRSQVPEVVGLLLHGKRVRKPYQLGELQPCWRLRVLSQLRMLLPPHARENAPTSGFKRGTVSQSTGRQ